MLDIIVAILVWLGGNPVSGPNVMSQRDWCSKPCITDAERRELRKQIRSMDVYYRKHGHVQRD